VRVLLTNFHRGWGGQAQQVLLLAGALRAAGHGVLVAAPPGSVLAERAAGAQIDAVTACRFPRGFRPARLARDVAALRRIVHRHGTQLVHAHGSQDGWLAAATRILCRECYALVRTKHNSYPVRPHAANRLLYGRWTDRTIAVAEPIREAILRLPGIRPERVVTIHAGIPDDFGRDVPPDARASVRAEFGLSEDAPLVGLVGRLAPDKGQEILLRALPAIRKRIPDAHALLVGTGGDYDRQQTLRDGLGLRDAATFTLFREDVARLTAACDVAVLAATACDASSTVLKEAMALGVPVVGSDVGGTREILEGGRAGRLVPPGDPDALADALADTLGARGTAALAEPVARARERARAEYAMSAVLARTLAVYRDAIRPEADA
jgi:glycosyltransferase involved in cell wall biosynthesis